MQILRSALLMSVWFSTLAAQVPPQKAGPPAGIAVVTPVPEKDLDAPGTTTLAPGDHFQIAVPLHLSIAVNLGAAQLDITLARKVRARQAEEDLHLVAVLGAAQASVKAGDRSVILHGVVSAFGPDRNGEYHPSDYSVHFGSGNIKNIGTPDESFIDTEALTNKLQNLRVRLTAVVGK